MRIKLLPVIVSCFILSLTIISCLGDDDNNITYSTDATISSFTLNNIVTLDTIRNAEGKLDTLLYFTTTGSKYPFAIDHLKGEIYNTTPLPFQTDLRKVSFSVSTSAYAIMRFDCKNPETGEMIKKDSTWLSTDSLDFREPILFRTHTYHPDYYNPEKKTYITKEYLIDIRVYQNDPDSLVWTKSNWEEGKGIDGEHKAILKDGDIYLFAPIGSKAHLLVGENGSSWTNTELNGIADKADCTSAILFNNQFYLLADQEVYSSTDGINWTNETDQAGANVKATALVAVFKNQLIAINNGKFIYRNADGSWEISNEEGDNLVPANFPDSCFAYTIEPLRTNPSIERLIMMGKERGKEDIDKALTDTSAVIWSTLSTETTWSSYQTTTTYDCPRMKYQTMIPYDGQLYSFGGVGKENKSALLPFQYIYTSKDNGRTWVALKKKVLFPAELQQRDIPFSAIVDEDNHIWILLGGSSAQIYKGRINRLSPESEAVE